ncbi:MAG: hypothetical protein A3K19_05380 [Lentisphaerae bacterium RIFOXYB12_FULL_65_16]|nr:MAG: hypothetical protein A3K18_15840 [Lentisphaerae bacterium RIFOXYA12_64_32]OGV94323.1 MAG: hypothetical protein A3K19_05380 [Lentisphaerae bacterium RIFOXYB12_FULL_65_16]
MVAAQHLPVGSRFPSTQQLMRKFGVSHMTMHLALDALVREGWLVRHRGKGTFVACNSAPRACPSQARLALVLPPQDDIRRANSEDTVLGLLYGAQAGAQGRDANLAIETLNSSSPGTREVDQMAEHLLRSYDGCLFVSNQFRQLIARIHSHLPLVIMCEDSREYSTVSSTRSDALRLAVEHLRDHGYQRVGYLGRLRDPSETKHLLFSEYVEKLQLTTRPEWFCDLPAQVETEEPIGQFLRQGARPRAVFIDNYAKAEAVVRVMEMEGLRVPQDIALITYGVRPSCVSYPWLAMVESPVFEVGREAVRLLDRLIRHEAVSPGSRTVPPRLVPGRSCGCPEAAAAGRGAGPPGPQ